MLKEKFSIGEDVFDMLIRRDEEFFLSDTLKRMRKPSFKPTKELIVRMHHPLLDHGDGSLISYN